MHIYCAIVNLTLQRIVNIESSSGLRGHGMMNCHPDVYSTSFRRMLSHLAANDSFPHEHTEEVQVVFDNSKDLLTSSILVFVFDLKGWSLLLNALRPFKIYCGPPPEFRHY